MAKNPWIKDKVDAGSRGWEEFYRIALAQHDINNATATLGTATSKTHLERIYRLCPEVLFCFDGDDAGRKAAIRAMEAALPCMEDGRQARFLFLPEGEDPDTIVRSGGKALFDELMANALPLETFLFESLSEGIDTASMDGPRPTQQTGPALYPAAARGVFRQLMFNALAERTGLEVSSLMQLEAPARPPEPPPEPPPEDEPHEPGPRQRMMPAEPMRAYSNFAQAAIALLLHQPQIAELTDSGELSELVGEDIDLLRELLDLLKRRPESNTAMLLGHWYGTAEGELLSRLAGQERLIPPRALNRSLSIP